MNILVTGGQGFLGKNLVASLRNIKDGKDRTHDIRIDEVFVYDVGSSPAELEAYCAQADFVFHLAGVNRPREDGDFAKGNVDLTIALLQALARSGNHCPVMLASSIQASLVGAYASSAYGRSKRQAEKELTDYGRLSGSEVLIYRFPNLFGKWSRPNYNSVVATFCYNIARGLPIRIDDPAKELELLYIDDVVAELLRTLSGQRRRCDYAGIDVVENPAGAFCYVSGSHRVSLGRIASLLAGFSRLPETLAIAPMGPGSFEKKLFSTYLSFLPPSRACFPLAGHPDARGCFTEILRRAGDGQISVNVSHPGIVKGEHWHHSKWEVFVVVSGQALIQERMVGGDEVTSFEVSGSALQAVIMLPGYAHSIANASSSEDLVTLIWANESFDPAHPDTFAEKV